MDTRKSDNAGCIYTSHSLYHRIPGKTGRKKLNSMLLMTSNSISLQTILGLRMDEYDEGFICSKWSP
jgi:hypothetical protein